MLNIATELDDYLRLRAAAEGVRYELDARWLARQMDRVRLTIGSPPISVFGVHIEDDQLVYDEQEPRPGFFEAWKRSKTGPGSTRTGVRIEWAARRGSDRATLSEERDLSVASPWIVARKPRADPQRARAEQEEREWGGEANVRKHHTLLAAKMLERQLGPKLGEFLAVASKADPNAIFDLLRACLDAADRDETVPAAVEHEPLLPLMAPEQADAKRPSAAKATAPRSSRQTRPPKRGARYIRPGRSLLDYGEMRHRCLDAMRDGEAIAAETVVVPMMPERALDPNRNQRVRSDLIKRALRALDTLHRDGRVQKIGKGLGVRWALVVP